MRGFLALAAAAVLLVALPAAAQFGGSRLFVNPSMKYDVGRTFGVGADFTIAPVKAAKKFVLQKLRSEYEAEYDAVLQATQYISPDDIRNADPSQIGALLKNSGAPLTDEQKAQIDSVVADIEQTQGQADTVLSILQEVVDDPDTTITFSLEPHAWLHFDPIDLYFTIPIAGFSGEDETKFAFGNIGVDARLGHIFGKGMAFGLSYGASFWLPSATSEANALGLANLAWSPRYFSGYTTVSPYVVLGGDFTFVTLQANVGANLMFSTSDDNALDSVKYLQFGGALSVTAIPYMVISAEVSGMSGLENADAYNSVYLTAGLRFAASIIDVGLGFQLPLVKSDPADVASFSNLDFGSPGDLNVILSLTVGI